MLDHISCIVGHYKESLRFYDETLSVLGASRFLTFEISGGRHVSLYSAHGEFGKPFFGIIESAAPIIKEVKERDFHVAFLAPSIEAIHAWHEKCLALGAQDNGAPGPRPEYHPGYYAAFILSPAPDRYKLEAVRHDFKGLS